MNTEPSLKDLHIDIKNSLGKLKKLAIQYERFGVAQQNVQEEIIKHERELLGLIHQYRETN